MVMSNFVSKSQSIRDKLKQEGKYTILNKEEHIKSLVVINKSLEDVRREFQVKDQKSQQNAAFVTLTA